MLGDSAPTRWRLAVDVLAVLTALALLMAAWGLYARFSDTNHQRKGQARIWHAVICDVQRSVVRSKKVSRADKAAFLVFYDKLLVEDAHAAPCGIKLPGGKP